MTRSKKGLAARLACKMALSFVVGRMAACQESGAYARELLGNAALVAYWPLHRDLKEAKGGSHGKPLGGKPHFVEGLAGGMALQLSGGRFVTMGATPELDLKETTVELWVQPNFKAGMKYNPCIIAKRDHGDHRQTRFSLHIQNDYSCLAVWNGETVTQYALPEVRLQKGQWHHVALTCDAGQMKLYVDGLPCEVISGGGLFDFGKNDLPLSLGSSSPKGQEQLECCIDEVVIYSRVLSEVEIAAHVDAMGRREHRLKLAAAVRERVEQEAKARAETDARRNARRDAILRSEELMARGEPTVYRGEHLTAISFPVGGIGSGLIQIDGLGRLAIWQIFNNHQHVVVPHSFFAVRVKRAECTAMVRALQGEPVGPFPAMKDISFRGEYPFGWFTFGDADLPVHIAMETFNPLVPLDARSSGIPCAIFSLTAANRTSAPVEVSFLASQQNVVGYLADKPIEGRRYSGFGGSENRVIRDGTATILHMTSAKPKDSPGYGDMALMAFAGEAGGAASWKSLENLAGEFATGKISGPGEAGPSAEGETLDGAIVVSFTLSPRETRAVTFALAWHFPNARHGDGGWHGTGNMYANWWPDALAVAQYLQENLDELTAETRLYHDSVYSSNLPYWLLDRISSQVAVLRSRTCFWAKDGYFGGWEGCNQTGGCCPGNCNHVWHYAQAHARLFPEIARRMREQELRFQNPETGAIPHRQPDSFPAFDGQCGAVLNSYREHLMSPDGAWLKEHWPSIKKAMDFTIGTWDRDEDGVLAGAQSNTLDGALGGSSSWLGSLCLAALAAGERMALLQDEPETAKRYASIRVSGQKKQDETLFNGEYYIQIPEATPNEDYGDGCHIDQVLGQWWAHQLDLGWLYPADHVRAALGSLVKHNFRGNFVGLKQSPRKFADDGDPGLQMITWPKGLQPFKVMRYSDEVMTGFEYSAAAAMVQAGMTREGLAVVRAVSMRYDGRLRANMTAGDYSSWGYSGNPFGDDECGKFYARAMSVWSMLLACQGYIYDGPVGLIGFLPVWRPADHCSFFSAAEGFGLFHQRREDTRQTERIEVRSGRLRIEALVFQVPWPDGAKDVVVRVGDKIIPSSFEAHEGRLHIQLEEPVVIQAGGPLDVQISWRKNQ